MKPRIINAIVAIQSSLLVVAGASNPFDNVQKDFAQPAAFQIGSLANAETQIPIHPSSDSALPMKEPSPLAKDSVLKTTVPARLGKGFLHSHNDYERSRPLLDALSAGFDSIEADIWISSDEIKISHLGLFFTGTLKEMYLDPLQKLVEKSGSVHGDDRPFYLWLDIKDKNPKLVTALQNLLQEYSMLTVFSDEKGKEGPVTIILTGHEPSKQSYVNEHSIRYACRDSNSFELLDPAADQKWLWYSLKWSDLFRWTGYSPMKELEREKLLALVKLIHQKGKRLRFWDAPENPQFWKVALEAEVDMLGTDHPSRLSAFFSSIRDRLLDPSTTPNEAFIPQPASLESPRPWKNLQMISTQPSDAP